ncbi:hypothetical protein [Bowmanella denitrificans]|uniref:hypothetical protein n=1 Tax=Bowmanella denitrificans TaxID=366582 RepID=UPI0011AF74CA|nr:hypothetical protein [Bowmanella denitrificans]
MMKEKSRDTSFSKRFMAAMALFLVLIAIQTFSLELADMPTWLQVVVTLLPVTPLIWAFVLFRERYRALDEYMKALTGEAFLWMIGILCFSSFIYGMLAMKFTLPPVNLALVLPVVFGGHGLILQLLIWKDNGQSN